MATHSWTGTTTADIIDLSGYSQPSSGEVYNFDGLGGNDTLYLTTGSTTYDKRYTSTGFTIGAADANGVIVVSGATANGKKMTFNLTSIETLVFYDKTVTLNYGPVTDLTAPLFASAAVNGTTLVMTYTDANNLDAANPPAAGAFTVSGHTVSGLSVNAAAKTVTLTLGTAVVNGETVTVSYSDPTTGNDSNALQDAAGNDAASLVAGAVTNNTPPPADTIAPLFASATVNGTTLVMTYTDANNLDAANPPAAGAFTVSGHTVSSVAVDAALKTVTLKLGTAVVNGETVTVAYKDPTTGNDAKALQDAAPAMMRPP